MSRIKNRLLFEGASGIALTAFFAGHTPALAQEQLRKGQESATALQEVVVTARRRAERLQDIPVAVTALTGQQLQQRGVTDIIDLQQTVPSLNMGTNTTTGGRKSVAVSLRGVRSSAVTIYFADVVQSPVAVSDLIYDLESVQVLKGPQGTLFGANSTAGAILFQPAAPTDTFEASLEGRAGNYNMWGATGIINIPLTEGVALRIAADREKRGGYLKGTVRDYDADNHYSVRSSLKAEFGPVQNWLVATYYNYNAQGSANVPLGFRPCGPVADSSVACLYRPPTTTRFGLPSATEVYTAELANGVRRTNLTGDYPRRLTNKFVSNITELDFGQPLGAAAGDVKFRSILGWTKVRSYELADTDGTILDIVTRNLASQGPTRSIETQLLGSNERFNWVVGYYGNWQRLATQDRTSTLQPLTAPPSSNTSNGRTRQAAFFAQATVEILNNFHVTAGYRTTKTTISTLLARTVRPCTFPAGGKGVDLATCTQISYLQEREPSWTLGVDYKFNPEGLIYFTTRRGFNQGGFNNLALTVETQTFKPETLTDYEIGLKQDLKIGGMPTRFNLAVFRSKYADIQRRSTPVVRVNGVDTFTALIVNAAKATIDGVEGELDISPATGLKLNLGVSYIDARYDEFILQNRTGTFDLTKNRLGQAPKWTVVAGVDYTFPELPGVGVPHVNVNYAYQSRIFTSDINGDNEALNNQFDLGNVQKGYGLVNARVSLADVAGTGVQVSLWAKNLFDELYFNARTNGGALGFTSGLPSEPRTYGVTVSRQF